MPLAPTLRSRNSLVGIGDAHAREIDRGVGAAVLGVAVQPVLDLVDPVDVLGDVDDHEGAAILAIGDRVRDHRVHLGVGSSAARGQAEDVEDVHPVERAQPGRRIERGGADQFGRVRLAPVRADVRPGGPGLEAADLGGSVRPAENVVLHVLHRVGAAVDQEQNGGGRAGGVGQLDPLGRDEGRAGPARQHAQPVVRQRHSSASERRVDRISHADRRIPAGRATGRASAPCSPPRRARPRPKLRQPGPGWSR